MKIIVTRRNVMNKTYQELKQIINQHKHKIMFDTDTRHILKPYFGNEVDLDNATAIFKYNLSEQDYNNIFKNKK